MSGRPLPPVVRIEPASACNLRCTHCPTGVVQQARTVMRPPVFERVLKELAKHVPPVRVAVLYHGGEPFLNKDFLSMASRVKALGIPLVKTVSNGMLITKEMCDQIVACGLDAIELSLDGDSAEDNDRIRVRSEFTRIVETVKHLVASNVRHGRRIRISIATVQFRRATDGCGSLPAPVPECLSTAFADVIDEVHFKPTWALLWPSSQPASRYDLLQAETSGPLVRSCSLLEETISIRADGTVVACCYDLLTQSNLGNVMTDTLEDIWNGTPYQEFRGAFADGRYPPLCANCAVVSGNKYLLKKQDAAGGQRVFTLALR